MDKTFFKTEWTTQDLRNILEDNDIIDENLTKKLEEQITPQFLRRFEETICQTAWEMLNDLALTMLDKED